MSNNPLTAANWQRMQEASMDFAPEEQQCSRKKSRIPSPSGVQAPSALNDKDVPKKPSILGRASRSRSASPRKTDPRIRVRDYPRGRDLRHARSKDLSHEDVRKARGWEHHAYPLPEEIYKPGDGPADFRQRVRLWYLEQDNIAAKEPQTLVELAVTTQRFERERKEREAKHAAIVAGVDVFKAGAWPPPSSIAEAVAPTQSEDDIVMAEGEEQAGAMMGKAEHDAAVQARFKDSGIHMHSDDDAALPDTGQAQDTVDIDIDLTSDIDTNTNTDADAAAVTAQEGLAQAVFKDSGIHVHSEEDATIPDAAGQVEANVDIDIDIDLTSDITTNVDTDADTAALIAQAEELVQANNVAPSTTGDDGVSDDDLDEGFASDDVVDDFFGGESQNTEDATEDSDIVDDSAPDLLAPSSSDYKGKSKKAALVDGDEGYIAPPPTEYDGILGTLTPEMEMNLGGDSTFNDAVSNATDDTDPELQAALLQSIQPAAGDTLAPAADNTTEADSGTVSDDLVDGNEEASAPASDTTESQVIVPKSKAFEFGLVSSEELASRCGTRNMSKVAAGDIVKNFMEKNSDMLDSFKFLDVVHNSTITWQMVSEVWFSREHRTEICGVIKLLKVLLDQYWPDIEREDWETLRPRLETYEALQKEAQREQLQQSQQAMKEQEERSVSPQQALNDIQGSNSYRKELLDLTGLAPSLFVDLLLSVENVMPQIENSTSAHEYTDAEELRLIQLQHDLRRIIGMLKCNVAKLMRETASDRDADPNLSPEENAKRLKGLDGMVEREGMMCVYGSSCKYGKNCINVQGPGHSVVSNLGIQISTMQSAANHGGPCPFVNRLNGCPQQQLGTCSYAHYNQGQTCTFWLKGVCCKIFQQCAFLHGQPAGGAPPPSPMFNNLEDLKLRIGEVGPENKWLGACAFVNGRKGCTNPKCTYNHTLKDVSCPKSDGDGSCSWRTNGQQCPFEHTRDGFVASDQAVETSRREVPGDGFSPINKSVQLANPPVGAPISPRATVGQSSQRPLPLGQVLTAHYPSPMSTPYGQQFSHGGFPGASSPMGFAIAPPWQSAPGQHMPFGSQLPNNQPSQPQRQHKAPANAPTGPKSMTQSPLSAAGRVAVQQGQSGQANNTRVEFGNMIRQNDAQQAAAIHGSIQQAQSGPAIAPPPGEFKSSADLLAHASLQNAAAGQGEFNGGSKRKYSNYESRDGGDEASDSRPKRSRNNGSHNNDSQDGGDGVPDSRLKHKKYNGHRNGGNNGRGRRRRRGG